MKMKTYFLDINGMGGNSTGNAILKTSEQVGKTFLQYQMFVFLNSAVNILNIPGDTRYRFENGDLIIPDGAVVGTRYVIPCSFYKIKYNIIQYVDLNGEYSARYFILTYDRTVSPVLPLWTQEYSLQSGQMGGFSGHAVVTVKVDL